MAIQPFRRALIESSDWFLPLVKDGDFDVLSISYSGSLGFGDDYAQSSIGQQGSRDLRDVVDTLSALTSVENRKVAGVFGGSYGGFLTLHAYSSGNEITRKVPKFAALYPYISSRGCAAETGDFAWEAEYCGTGSENVWPVPPACIQPDLYPKFYSMSDEALKKPLLLFHGDSDNVCPLSQSKQTYHILRQRGSKGSVNLVVYKGEGHGFRNDRVRKDCIERLLAFFKTE